MVIKCVPPQRSTDGEEQLKYSFFDQSKNPPDDRPQQLNSCCTKSIKFCKSGSSRYLEKTFK